MLGWFERRLTPFPPEEPVEPPRTLVAFCRHYTRGSEPWLLVSALLMAVIAVAEVWLFGFMGNIVTWLSDQDPRLLWQQRGSELLGMLAVILALPLLVGLHAMLNHQTLMGNYPMRIRWMVHRYLLRQSMSFYQNEFAGRIATKLMQTALAVRECVIKLIDVLNYVAVYFLGTVVLIGSSDWRLALPLLGWLVAYVLMLAHFVPRLRAVSGEQADARSLMTGRIVDSYTNIQTVKLFSHARRESAYAREGMGEFMTTVYAQMRLVTQLIFTLYLLNTALLLAVATVSLQLWLAGELAVGAVAVALALVLRLSGMSQWIMWEVSALFENIGTVQDGMGSISRPQEVMDVPQAPALNVSRGDIRFEQVRFGYGNGRAVFDGLDLHIRPGERVGLVGPSGAGKSTLVNLLLRFHDLDSGRILIDGQDIAQVTQESLRAQIGMVTQDTSLLHRSVRDNLLYGRPDASDEAMVAAARQAQAHEFILGLHDARGRQGYHAHVGERGVTLSGGQRQRIAIARVMLKDAPVLLLDEATSALDSEVEAAIQDNLYRLMAGKTVIAIAHRLSTIAAMDRLVVLDQGRIVESGSHDDLLTRGGVYARLWAHQSGGFLVQDADG